jgi:hypothetical protein
LLGNKETQVSNTYLNLTINPLALELEMAMGLSVVQQALDAAATEIENCGSQSWMPRQHTRARDGASTKLLRTRIISPLSALSSFYTLVKWD